MIGREEGLPRCLLCGSEASIHKTALTTSGDSMQLGSYAVYFCTRCRNGFTYPQAPPETFRLMPDISRHRLSRIARSALHMFMQKRVSRLQVLGGNRQHRRLLDVGGGSCAFANEAASQGFDVTVIEPNENNAVFADTGRDVTFIARSFTSELIESQLLPEATFDIVTMWHSLEHFLHPAETLQLAHRLLKPGGLILVSVPNLDSCQAKFGGNFWVYLDVPHHATHFTPVGISLALEQAGFDRVASFPFSLEYDLFGWYQTLLNVLTRSYNYYYNKTKKHRIDEGYLPYPRWTKAVTSVGIAILPVAAACTCLALLLRSPSCIELLYRKKPQ